MILVVLESLLKDLQSLFLPPRLNSNYSDRYRVWKCIKKVSAIRQACYNVMLFSSEYFSCAIAGPYLYQFAGSGQNLRKEIRRLQKATRNVRKKKIPKHSYTFPKTEDFFQRDWRRRFKDSRAQLQHGEIHILPNILFLAYILDGFLFFCFLISILFRCFLFFSHELIFFC